MPNFSKPLPPARSTGDAGPAADVNAIVAAITEVKALVPDAYTDAKAVTANTAAVAAKYTKPAGGIPEADLVSAFTARVADSATQGQLTDAIAGIVGAAPANLNTLAELAGALGDDGDLAGTLDGLLALKYAKPVGGIPATDLSAPLRDLLVTVAANAAQITALSSTVDQIVNPPAAAPTAITLTAAAADGRVTITRAGGESATTSGQPTATTYALYRGTTATGTPIATKFPYVDTGLLNGATVSYIATAKNTQGTTTSAVVTATPTGIALPTPVAFFKAANITGVAEDGKVAAVPTGGGGPGWEQNDVAVQPTYKAAYNGRPAIFCNGGWMKTAASLPYDAKAFVAAWVWLPGAPNSTTAQTIAASDDGPSGGGSKRLWQLKGEKPGNLRLLAFNGANNRTDTISGLTGGAWRLVAGRCGPTSTETWIDGVSDGATGGGVSSSTASSRPVMIGGASAAAGAPAVEGTKGYISEVRVYYRDVTADEVRAIFADMGLVTQ